MRRALPLRLPPGARGPPLNELPAELAARYTLVRLRGGSRDGQTFWSLRPPHRFRVAPGDEEEYVRGAGNEWWCPAPPAAGEAVTASVPGDQLALL